jgi:hypothetical protein
MGFGRAQGTEDIINDRVLIATVEAVRDMYTSN